MGWVINTLRRLHPGDEIRYSLYMGLGGSQGVFWTVAENLAATRIQSPESPVPSESLYRLSYSVPSVLVKVGKKITSILYDDTLGN